MPTVTPSAGTLTIIFGTPQLGTVFPPAAALTLTPATPLALYGLRPAAATTLTLTPQLTRIIKGVRPIVAALTLTGKVPRTPLLDVPAALVKVIGFPPIINPADQDMDENFDRDDPNGLGNQWQQVYTGPGASRFVANGAIQQAHWVVQGDGPREVVNRWLGVNQKEVVALAGNVVGGTFKLTWNGFTTAPIPYNATAAQVKAALEALPGVNLGDVEVTVS